MLNDNKIDEEEERLNNLKRNEDWRYSGKVMNLGQTMSRLSQLAGITALVKTKEVTWVEIPALGSVRNKILRLTLSGDTQTIHKYIHTYTHMH